MTRERLMHTSLVIRMYDIDFLQRRNKKNKHHAFNKKEYYEVPCTNVLPKVMWIETGL